MLLYIGTEQEMVRAQKKFTIQDVYSKKRTRKGV
jgi:hypothetical protein